MAHFFAHVRTSTRLIPDNDGFELANIGRLRETAAKIAADLVAKDPHAINWTFELSDENGRTVLRLPLSECLSEGALNKD